MPTLPAAEIDRLLDSWPVARLATIRADGRPHLVPVVFARSQSAIWSPIDGKPKAAHEPLRVQNIRNNSRVSLLLDHYTADWAHLWWVRVDGQAEVIAVAEREAQPAVTAALDALSAKYPQYGRGTPVLNALGLLLRIVPQTRASWSASVHR